MSTTAKRVILHVPDVPAVDQPDIMREMIEIAVQHAGSETASCAYARIGADTRIYWAHRHPRTGTITVRRGGSGG